MGSLGGGVGRGARGAKGIRWVWTEKRWGIALVLAPFLGQERANYLEKGRIIMRVGKLGRGRAS